MPKAAKNKKNAAPSGGPYAAAAAKSKAAHSIFKFNTDLGQHILKNPGVAQAIVDKADLKQSDVCPCASFWALPADHAFSRA